MIQSTHWYNTNEERSKSRFKRRVRRMWQIISHPRDAWLVLRVLLWAFILPALKRVVPLKKLAPLLWLAPRVTEDRDQETKIAAVVKWIYIFIFSNETSCLERSLLLYRFLSRINRDPLLVTGMRLTEDREWKGHAWIELDGTPFEEKVTHVQDFRALIVFGAKGIMRQAASDSPAL